MKTKKESRKQLTARILEKIQEAFSGVDDKAVKKIKRSAEGTAKKLAKKISATVEKITKKQEASAAKAKKKEAKKAKKSNKAQPVQAEKVVKKKENVHSSPAAAAATSPKLSTASKANTSSTRTKSAPKKREAAPVQVNETSANGVHKDENKEA